MEAVTALARVVVPQAVVEMAVVARVDGKEAVEMAEAAKGAAQEVLVVDHYLGKAGVQAVAELRRRALPDQQRIYRQHQRGLRWPAHQIGLVPLSVTRRYYKNMTAMFKKMKQKRNKPYTSRTVVVDDTGRKPETETQE